MKMQLSPKQREIVDNFLNLHSLFYTDEEIRKREQNLFNLSPLFSEDPPTKDKTNHKQITQKTPILAQNHISQHYPKIQTCQSVKLHFQSQKFETQIGIRSIIQQNTLQEIRQKSFCQTLDDSSNEQQTKILFCSDKYYAKIDNSNHSKTLDFDMQRFECQKMIQIDEEVKQQTKCEPSFSFTKEPFNLSFSIQNSASNYINLVDEEISEQSYILGNQEKFGVQVKQRIKSKRTKNQGSLMKKKSIAKGGSTHTNKFKRLKKLMVQQLNESMYNCFNAKNQKQFNERFSKAKYRYSDSYLSEQINNLSQSLLQPTDYQGTRADVPENPLFIGQNTDLQTYLRCKRECLKAKESGALRHTSPNIF